MIPKSLLYKLTNEESIVLAEGSKKDMERLQKKYKKEGKVYRIWIGSCSTQLGQKME
jgi:GTP-dependent phosphoenolpyruvate carboxykinase